MNVEIFSLAGRNMRCPGFVCTRPCFWSFQVGFSVASSSYFTLVIWSVLSKILNRALHIFGVLSFYSVYFVLCCFFLWTLATLVSLDSQLHLLNSQSVPAFSQILPSCTTAWKLSQGCFFSFSDYGSMLFSAQCFQKTVLFSHILSSFLFVFLSLNPFFFFF